MHRSPIILSKQSKKIITGTIPKRKVFLAIF
jgi:hypothetical protein